MIEEMLLKIVEEVNQQKEIIKEENERVKRIKKLENMKLVKEYLELTNLFRSDESIKSTDDHDYVMRVFNKYLYKINSEDTNGIYVCLGTYEKSFECDIVHGSSDNLVSPFSKNADYRLYRDLEQSDAIQVNINECEEFERTHTVIHVGNFGANREYYRLQEEFVCDAVNIGQEKAKIKILKKLTLNKKKDNYLSFLFSSFNMLS